MKSFLESDKKANEFIVNLTEMSDADSAIRELKRSDLFKKAKISSTVDPQFGGTTIIAKISPDVVKYWFDEDTLVDRYNDDAFLEAIDIDFTSADFELDRDMTLTYYINI